MNNLGKAKRGWMIFCILLPFFFFILTGCGKKKENGSTTSTRAVPVVVAVAKETTFFRSLRLQGTVISKNFALVPAKTGGTIESLLVDEGDKVIKGQALCKLDSENLSRTVEMLRQDVAVAGSALKVSQALEEQAKTGLSQAKRDLDRYRKLAEEDAVPARRLEETETRWKNSTAAHKVALAQVDLAGARLKQAEAAHAIADRNLKDATVTAPISGIISERYHETGEMVKSGNSVFRIDDPSAVEISAFAPASNYGHITPTQSVMRVRINDVNVGETPVTYRSPVIEENLRTFEVKALLTEPPAAVVAGAIADVDIVLQKREGRGVPTTAILLRGGKEVIFVLTDKKARQLTVRTGLHTDGLVEILEGLPDGDASVIIQGQDLVNDGDAIVVVEDK